MYVLLKGTNGKLHCSNETGLFLAVLWSFFIMYLVCLGVKNVNNGDIAVFSVDFSLVLDGVVFPIFSPHDHTS